MRVSAEKLKSGDALAQAAFGESWNERLLRDQRVAIAADVEETEPFMPREMDYRVGTKKRDDSDADKSTIILRYMPLAGTALFSVDRIADALTPLVRELYAKLKSKSPYVTGVYRNSFRYVLNGRGGLREAPKDLAFNSIVGVTNLAEYASTLENPRWPQPFRKVYRAFAGKHKFAIDVRFRYMKANDAGVRHNYALPVIEIANKGIMGRNTGIRIIRRRSTKTRR